MDPIPSPELVTLKTQIQTLTDLYNRLQSLRQIPPLLLRPASIAATPSISHGFQEIKDMADELRSTSVQEALRKARDSETADKTGLTSNTRRENRKRRRPPSPESPQPYVVVQTKTSSLFPVSDDETPLRMDGLPEYIREFNRSHQSKLHIWSYTRQASRKAGNPVTVRFTIPDVLTAFAMLGYDGKDPVLVVEVVTVFGPRERKLPHSQSEYIAYQSLSQQIARMVQSHPLVSFQCLMSLMCSYEGLFVDRCTCERVLSADGHVPPVARIWIDATSEGEKGKWAPRHVSCPQN